MRIRSWDQVRIDRVCAAGVIIICAMTSFSICQSRSRIRALERVFKLAICEPGVVTSGRSC